MARRSSHFKIYPRDHLVKPGDWPGGRLKRGAPLEVLLARGISARLRKAMADEGLSAVKVAAKTDVGIQTVCEVLNGTR